MELEEPYLQNLVHLFVSRAERHGTRAFLHYKAEGRYVPISWLELAGRILAAREALCRWGVRAGDRVALLSENRPEWVIADIAISACAAATVPIYPSSSREEIRYMLQHSGAVCGFLSSAEQAQKVKGLEKEVSGFKGFVSFDGGSGLDRLQDLEAQSARESDPLRALKDLTANVTRQTLATVIYTSGTTGRPKGAALTHGNFLSNCEAGRYALEIGDRDIGLSYLPLSHVFERMAGYYFLMQQGAQIAYAESFKTVPQNFLEVRPTIMTSVPRLYEKMHAAIMDNVRAASPLGRSIFQWALRTGKSRGEKVSARRSLGPLLALQMAVAQALVLRKIQRKLGGRLRFFISGGAPLSKEIAEFFYSAGILILEGYGLTETSPVVAVNRNADFRFGTVGKPLPGVEVKLESDGEILVRGPNVMQGYFRDEEATRAVFRDGWFCTGDVGEFDSGGYLRITDRKKEIIVTSLGKKVPPQVVEGLLAADPLFSQVVLYGERRPFITALVVPNFSELERYAASEGIGFSCRKDLVAESKVIELYRTRIAQRLSDLAEFMKPKLFCLLEQEFSLEAGELTPTLKFKRSVIAQRYASQLAHLYSS